MAKDSKPTPAGNQRPADPFGSKPQAEAVVPKVEQPQSEPVNVSGASGNGISTAALQGATDEQPALPAVPVVPGRRPSNELSDVRTSLSETGSPVVDLGDQNPQSAPLAVPAAVDATVAKPVAQETDLPGRYLVEFSPETGVAHRWVELDANSAKSAWSHYCQIVGISRSKVAPTIRRIGEATGEDNVLGPAVEPLQVKRRDPVLVD